MLDNRNIDVVLRPKTIEEMFDGDNSIENIISRIHTNKHSFLITGPSGNGKTTLARLIATYLFTGSRNAEYDLQECMSYIEVDASKYTGVEGIRETLESVSSPPLHSEKIVLVLDEAHYLSKNSMSALLKTLEEPPDHLYIIICTDQPSKLTPAVKNRCTHFPIQYPSTTEMKAFTRQYILPKLMDFWTSTEIARFRPNIDSLTDSKLDTIITTTDGSFRSLTIALYDYLVTGNINYVIENQEAALKDFHNCLFNINKSWRKTISGLFDSITDYEAFRISLCNYLSVIYKNMMLEFELRSGKDFQYLFAIQILKTELSYTCQKADLYSRLIEIGIKCIDSKYNSLTKYMNMGD